MNPVVGEVRYSSCRLFELEPLALLRELQEVNCVIGRELTSFEQRECVTQVLVMIERNEYSAAVLHRNIIQIIMTPLQNELIGCLAAACKSTHTKLK